MHDPILEAIVELTRQRDPDELGFSLLSTLAELTALHECALFRRSEARRDALERILSASNASISGSPQLEWNSDLELEDDADILETFRSCRETRRERGGILQYLLPVATEADRAFGVVTLFATEGLDEMLPLIRGLLRIYGNYLALIDEGARDKLTGLLNRRTFDSKVRQLLQRQRAPSRKMGSPERRGFYPADPAWLAVLDVDHFKQVNDRFGHLYGDEVLLVLAQKLRSGFRRSDLLFRFGGEEFVVILEPSNLESAVHQLEQLREVIATHDFNRVGRVTVSVGVAGVHPGDYVPTVLERADRALYYAKENGRNRVASYELLVDRGNLESEPEKGSIELF